MSSYDDNDESAKGIAAIPALIISTCYWVLLAFLTSGIKNYEQRVSLVALLLLASSIGVFVYAWNKPIGKYNNFRIYVSVWTGVFLLLFFIIMSCK